MSKVHLILPLAFAAALLSGCDRESAPPELSGFSEGEYYGSFESLRLNQNEDYYIMQRGEIDFYFSNSIFYYEGMINYSADDIYPLEINSQGQYEFSQDTIRFIETYIPVDSIRSGSINLLPFFNCEYAGSVMYLTRYSGNEKLTITLRKR